MHETAEKANEYGIDNFLFDLRQAPNRTSAFAYHEFAYNQSKRLGYKPHSKHVLLSNEGANKFAREQGLEIVDNKYFFTQKKYDRLQKILEKEQKDKAEKHGTVGCVVLDKEGNLAAGTSTGGMTNKMFGRIGDSPIIGAGTYANNNTCAVSCTGHGEFFIRYAVAHDVSAIMEYKGLSLDEATNYIVNNNLLCVKHKYTPICFINNPFT